MPLREGVIDLSAFYPDLGLPVGWIRDLEIVESKAAAVITIENKSSFYQYLREGPTGRLVIYLGGYHNRGRRLLLEKLAAYYRKEGRAVPFYHWGDMDLGGFQIWRHLKTKTGIAFEPLLMDVQTYLRCCHLAPPLGNLPCKAGCTAGRPRLRDIPHRLMLEKSARRAGSRPSNNRDAGDTLLFPAAANERDTFLSPKLIFMSAKTAR